MIISLLTQPSCSIIKQISINFDYIEVLPKATFFHISKKTFVYQPEINGSPRAFVFYNFKHGRVPKPKPFIEGIIIFIQFHILYKYKQIIHVYFNSWILTLYLFRYLQQFSEGCHATKVLSKVLSNFPTRYVSQKGIKVDVGGTSG